MSTSNAFSSGFGGCLGVGCAVVFVLVVLPVGCLMIGGSIAGFAPRPSRDGSQGVEQSTSTQPDYRPAKSTPRPEPKQQSGEEAIERPILVMPQGLVEPEPEPTMRTWTDATGSYSVEAEFRGVAFGKVKLRQADGRDITLPLDKLSDDDRKWIAERSKARR